MNTKNKVDEYINSFPSDIQFKLQAIRMLIFKLAPEVDESFSYGMPAYKIFKKPLIYYAAYKNHIGLYATPSGQKAYAKELENFKQGKGSVQFPNNEKLPMKLIEKIIKFKINENKENAKLKNLK
jgi:uncharacterized protein YdhG (YjbR/CyaY superfamily)